jgi:hypothetical protein
MHAVRYAETLTLPMFQQSTSYMSPRLEYRVHPQKGGYGVFVRQPVAASDLLVVWGGEVFTAERLMQLPVHNRRRCVQVDEGLYLVPQQIGPADYVNHSCNPNAGMQGQISLVARRNLQPGEEVCYDYAMTDGSPYDEFECTCSAQNCRGRVTGSDWRRPELWEKYANQFSPYLQRRIDRLRQMKSTR